MEAKLIIFAAPSGAGKTTLVRHLLKKLDNLCFSVSATTRKKRGAEVDTKDYYFISKEEFVSRNNKEEFLEWQEVYDGNFYGTLKSEVESLLEQGKNVIFDIDVKGALNIKKEYGERALAIFVQPPSILALKERLQSRNTETPESLAKRLAKAAVELEHASFFDIILLNDDIDKAKKEAEELVNDFLEIVKKKEISLMKMDEPPSGIGGK